MQGSLRYEFYDSHFETVLPYLAVLNLLLKFIPQQSLQGICQYFPYDLLFGGGAMHAWYGCACLPICQIRQHWIYAESDVAIDRCIRIMRTWPHHPLISNNKSYGKSWRIPCRDCWGMNFESKFSTAKYGNTVSKWLSYNSYLSNPCMEYVKTFHMICYLVLNGGGAMHDMDVPVCQYARFGSTESMPNLMLPLTDTSVSFVHGPTTI